MGNPNMKKGGGSDMTLESRHLIGIFLGLVVICCVFFTLGYAMGRTQFETNVKAAPMGKPETTASAPSVEPMGKATEKASPAVPSPSDWTFPTAAEPKKAEERLQPPPPKNAASNRAGDMKVELNPAPAKREPVKTSPAVSPVAGRAKAPAIPHGAFVLQVAALSKEADALALATALQQKRFSAFVLQPMGDHLYRVQVGPYANSAAADAGKKALLQEGFKAILKK